MVGLTFIEKQQYLKRLEEETESTVFLLESYLTRNSIENRSTVPKGRLNAMQISLLRLFDREMTDKQILELKRVLVKHYSALIQNEVERVVTEKGYTQDDFDKMLNSPS